MVLPETWLHARLTNDFCAEDSFAIIYEAGVFDAGYKHQYKYTKGKIDQIDQIEAYLKGGITVEEGIKPLKEVYKDAKDLIEAV